MKCKNVNYVRVYDTVSDYEEGQTYVTNAGIFTCISDDEWYYNVGLGAYFVEDYRMEEALNDAVEAWERSGGYRRPYENL